MNRIIRSLIRVRLSCNSTITSFATSNQLGLRQYRIKNSKSCCFISDLTKKSIFQSRFTCSTLRRYSTDDTEMRAPSKSTNMAKESKEDKEKEAVSGCNLDDLDIAPEVLERMRSRGYTELFPVQEQSFPHALAGSDMLVQSRTGTGKTLAFALPIVLKLLKVAGKKAEGQKLKTGRTPRVLVLAPTRELAKQIAEEFKFLLPPSTGHSVLPVYGGVPYEKHETALAAGVDVLVGAPGRVKDLMEQGKLKLHRVRYVVLDEVDRMLDLGFRDAVEAVLQTVYAGEKQPQTLLFSATLPNWVQQTAGNYLRSDATVKLDLITGDGGGRAAQTVRHLAILSPLASRSTAIADVIRVRGGGSTGRCIVFCERKRYADELAAHAAMSGDCHVLHGDIPQEKRELVLKKFKEGKYRVLVTTDVAARGIDIPHIDLVIQCQPPKDTEAYIHRAGRTGRAGREGVAVTFYTVNEEQELRRVEKLAGVKFTRIGAPTAEDLVAATARDSLKDLIEVPEKTLALLKDSAAEIIGEIGAERAVAAALVLLSGKTEIVARSLLSAREGFTAFVLHTSADNVRGKGYLYGALRRCLEPEQVEKVQYATFTSDRRAIVFDLPSEMEPVVEANWTDGKWDRLERLKELPELEQVQRDQLQQRHRQPANHNYQAYGGKGFGGSRPGQFNGGYRGKRPAANGQQRQQQYQYSGAAKRQRTMT